MRTPPAACRYLLVLMTAPLFVTPLPGQSASSAAPGQPLQSALPSSVLSEDRLLVDTRKSFRENVGMKSFLYCNWGEAENDGMKALLTADAPKGLRWVIERARAADHQQTPLIALPSALYEYFAGVLGANRPPAIAWRKRGATPGLDSRDEVRCPDPV